MNFYRIKYGKTAVCFRTEEVFSKKEDVIKYALDNKLFEKKKEYYEAEKIFESDYVEYLRDRLYDIFIDEYEEFKAGMKDFTVEEICDEWAEISARKNVMALLDGGYDDWIKYESLEKWILDPNNAVRRICKIINEQDFSEDNEKIYSILNREGMEVEYSS